MKVKLNTRIVATLVALSVVLTAAFGAANASLYNSEPADDGPTFSGSIVFPMEDEPLAIRNAPAYDVAEARKYVDDMPKIRELIDGVNEGANLVAFGEKKPSEEALSRLNEEIQKLSQGSHKVSLLMVDLKTKSGVAYNTRVPMCTQSTIKAIYVGAVLDDNPKALDENGAYMREAVEFSANEPYETLRVIYGTEPILKWSREVGVDDGFVKLPYPRSYTVRDMFKMWTKLYSFLNSDAVPGDFAAYYAYSKCSASKEQFEGRFPVQTKAGWESGLSEDLDYAPESEVPDEYVSPKYKDGDPTNDERAINDTGVVYSDLGPYLFVVFTDRAYATFRDYVPKNPLRNLVERLYETQRSIQTNGSDAEN